MPPKKHPKATSNGAVTGKSDRRKPLTTRASAKTKRVVVKKVNAKASSQAASKATPPALRKSGAATAAPQASEQAVELAKGAPGRSKVDDAKPDRSKGAAKEVAEGTALRITIRPAGKSKRLPMKAGTAEKRGARADSQSAPATQLDPIQFPEEKPKKVKTHLSPKQLREFRELLLSKRAELAGDVRRLTSEALHKNDNGSNDHSTMPIHMADLGTDAWEQDFTLGLIANEEAVVREIDDALRRIDDKTYGICLATDKPISVARLYAKPWAKYCIEYARLREEGRAP